MLPKGQGSGQGPLLPKRGLAHGNGPVSARSGLASCSGHQLFCDLMYKLFPWLSPPFPHSFLFSSSLILEIFPVFFLSQIRILLLLLLFWLGGLSILLTPSI